MSKLQKKISTIGRREGPGIGFAAGRRAQPRAMLLGLLVGDAAAAAGAIEAGVDLLVVRGPSAGEVARQVKAADAAKHSVGALLPSLDTSGAEELREAGCDFVISPLESTAADAVETERMGQVVAVSGNIAETTLRALGPLGLDALFVEAPGGGVTLAGMLDLVRLSSFASTPLMVAVGMDPSVAELRVLRDAGAAIVLAPEAASVDQVRAIGEALRQVPEPRRAKREGADIALVPAAPAPAHEHEDDDDEGRFD